VRLAFGVLSAAICVSTACGRSASPGRSGRVDASWTGADSGRIATRVASEWCPERRLLEIRAIQGDTGLAVVLYPVDTIEPDTYRVVLPESADTSPPAAAVALRVFSSNAVQGYQGDSGSVVMDRSSSGALSGTVEARLRSAVNGQLLTISGRLRDLVVVPQHRGCGEDTVVTPDTINDSIQAKPDSPRTDVD
jgi:hypothetical protein